MRPVARIVTRQVRPDGGLCIFEVNARVGADLACDVPRRRAAVFFEKLESLGDPMHARKGAPRPRQPAPAYARWPVAACQCGQAEHA